MSEIHFGTVAVNPSVIKEEFTRELTLNDLTKQSCLRMNTGFWDYFLKPKLTNDNMLAFKKNQKMTVKIRDLDSENLDIKEWEFEYLFEKGKYMRCSFTSGWKDYRNFRQIQSQEIVEFSWVDASSQLIGVKVVSREKAPGKPATDGQKSETEDGLETSKVGTTQKGVNEQKNTKRFEGMEHRIIVVAHPCDTSDIAMGRESVIVSLEKLLDVFSPTFHYISQNVISDNADLKISLAQIGDRDCCVSCHADCSTSSSCNCLQRNGGEFPYTADSLVREEFLNDSVSVARRFIKECNTKCGCGPDCVNRVVQRGIKYKLQVFWTLESKGWGLRTLEDLPKGAFVCEFVGEILTTAELQKRNLSRSPYNHSYCFMLDIDREVTRALKKEQFLCLDATFYGNVGRFINHRCRDANLIYIPVEVELPSHQYYHVALFTTRNVAAFEELTWDYGIDFDDNELHIKAFDCLCGSEFCRYLEPST